MSPAKKKLTHIDGKGAAHRGGLQRLPGISDYYSNLSIVEPAWFITLARRRPLAADAGTPRRVGPGPLTAGLLSPVSADAQIARQKRSLDRLFQRIVDDLDTLIRALASTSRGILGLPGEFTPPSRFCSLCVWLATGKFH